VLAREYHSHSGNKEPVLENHEIRNDYSLKQHPLPQPRSAKRFLRQGWQRLRISQPLQVDPELLAKHIGPDALALHSAAEVRVVELAAPKITEAVEYLVLAVGKMLLQSGGKQLFDSVGQPQWNEPGIACPGITGCSQDLRHLMIVQAGNGRGDHDTDRNARLGEFSNSRQPTAGPRRTGFKPTGQRIVQ